MRRLVSVLAVAVAMIFPAVGAGAEASPGSGPVGFGPKVSRLDPVPGLAHGANFDHGVGGPGANPANTVPLWSGSYSAEGVTWPTTMVGTDPALGSATTTVPAEIIPLRLVFASDGNVLDGATFAQNVATSPLFQPADFGAVGVTQWSDAFQRANFWASVSTVSPDYHVLLGGPTVLPTVTLRVPADRGATIFWAPYQRLLGGVDAAWLDARLNELLGKLHIDTRTLPIFLTDNVLGVLSGVDIPTCLKDQDCPAFGGFHAATVRANPSAQGAPNPALFNGQGQPMQTYVYASTDDPGVELPPGIDESTYAVSHEVMEWMDDPLALGSKSGGGALFGSLAPPWTSPFDPDCQGNLEVSDPVVFVGLGVLALSGNVDVFADAAMRSWFAREVPSTAIGGRYDIARALEGPSTPCTL